MAAATATTSVITAIHFEILALLAATALFDSARLFADCASRARAVS